MPGIFEALSNLIDSIFNIFVGILNGIYAIFQSIFAVFQTLLAQVLNLTTSIVGFLIQNIVVITFLGLGFIGYRVYIQRQGGTIRTNTSSSGGGLKKTS